MLAWRHGGFPAHNEVSVAAEDAERRKKPAGYMLCAPMSSQKMTYDAASGTVIYRSEIHFGLIPGVGEASMNIRPIVRIPKPLPRLFPVPRLVEAGPRPD